MGIRTRIAGWIAKAAGFVSTTQRGAGGWTLSSYSGSQRTDEQILEAYDTHAPLHGVASKISEAFASLEWTLSATKGNSGQPMRSRARMVKDPDRRALMLHVHKQLGQVEDLAVHPVLSAIDFGNAMLDGFAVMQLTQLYLDLTGDAILCKGFDDRGTIESLWPVPITWVRKRPTPSDPFYTFLINGQTITRPEDEVIWIKEPRPSDPYGFGSSAAASLSTELDTDEYAAKFVASFYRNHGVPAVMVSNENASGPEVRDQKQKWADDHRGPEKAWGVLFTNKKISVHKLAAEFKGKQSIEVRKYLRDEIRQQYGVPPEVMGNVDNSNRATIEGAMTIMAVYVIVPRAERVRIALQRQLVDPIAAAEGKPGSLILGYVSPVPVDKEHRLSVMKAAPTFFTLNQWQLTAGFSPLEGAEGELVMVESNERPSTLADLRAEVGAEPATDAKGLNGSSAKLLTEGEATPAAVQ
jgi:phage portal protein BeeE